MDQPTRPARSALSTSAHTIPARRPRSAVLHPPSSTRHSRPAASTRALDLPSSTRALDLPPVDVSR
ncbi:hypothetical protein ACFQYP_62285 [Nonomuraea antimicrobica]